MRSKRKEFIPHEDIEQGMLIEWAEAQKGKYPELAMIFHIPNEAGTRTLKETLRLKGLGVKAGVPDLFLPVARWAYHGLFIEMKRQKGGRVTEEQAAWHSLLTEQGYCVKVCKGFSEARHVLEVYLTGRNNNDAT